jgi:hypothetical protein
MEVRLGGRLREKETGLKKMYTKPQHRAPRTLLTATSPYTGLSTCIIWTRAPQSAVFCFRGEVFCGSEMSSLDDSWEGFVKHKKPDYFKQKEEPVAEIQKPTVHRQETPPEGAARTTQAVATPAVAAAPVPGPVAPKVSAAGLPGPAAAGAALSEAHTARCPFCSQAIVENSERCVCGAFLVAEPEKKRKSKGAKEKKVSK